MESAIQYPDEPIVVDGIYMARSGYNYTSLFFYEKKFFNSHFIHNKKEWMLNNWHMSIFYSILYIVAVHLGQHIMKTRQKFDLRRGLVSWSFVLAAFSIVGTIRVWPEFIYTFKTYGFQYTICDDSYIHGVNGCWSLLFCISKVPELIDTLFIVLRKQPLIFLHWYHHASVLIYCWYSSKDFASTGRWFVLMNFTVHAGMYTYYGFKALRFNIPKWVNIVITSAQLSQMFFGIGINVAAFQAKRRGDKCHISDENIMWSFIMYFSYFCLFFKFFYTAYIAKPKLKKSANNVTNGDVNGTANGINGVKINGSISNKKIN